MKFNNFSVEFQNIEDFIYKRKTAPSSQISFGQLSRLAHKSHDSITRRYRKFMAFKRSDDININKARAKRCCNMVKKHLNDLKEVQSYLNENGLQNEHPVFSNKINKWIDQCERIHSRYKNHIKEL